MSSPEIRVEHRMAAGVPLLLAMPAHARAAMPLVFWFHGFGADKDVHRPELERVAAAGFLAAGVDAVGHGARRFADLDERVAGPRDRALRAILELVDATAAEIPAVVRALVHDGLADPRRVAAVGISMGGYLIYRAVMIEPSIRTAVAILGSPEWPAGDSPHHHPEAFHHTALLSITAEHDTSVPPAGARRFHEVLAASHPAPDRARYLELAGGQHLMSAEHWATTIDETIRWLRRHAAAGAR